MREILFRGKRTDNHQWVEGYYIVDDLENPSPYIISRWKHRVSHKTIGQYTGLKDRNGNKVFEGDILQTYYMRGHKNEKTFRFVVKYGEYTPRSYCRAEYAQWDTIGFYCLCGEEACQISTCSYMYEIVGNIHDNPDLLDCKEE